MDDDHSRRGQAPEQHDHVPPNSIGQQERSAQPHDEDEHRKGDFDRTLVLQEHVVSQVKGREEKRKQDATVNMTLFFIGAQAGVGSPIGEPYENRA